MRYLHSKWLYKQAMQRTCSQMQAAATSLNRRHTELDQTVRANRLGFQFFKRLSWLAKCYRTDEQHRRSKVCFAVWSALGCRRNGRIVCSIVCTSYSQFIFMPLDKWQCIFTMARGICVRFGSFFFFFSLLLLQNKNEHIYAVEAGCTYTSTGSSKNTDKIIIIFFKSEVVASHNKTGLGWGMVFVCICLYITKILCAYYRGSVINKKKSGHSKGRTVELFDMM